jgi:hypothetical protein
MLLALCAFVGVELVAATVDLPVAGQPALPLGERMEFLLDLSGSLSFEDARRETGFAPSAGSVPSFGFISGALWGRCVLRNVSDQPQAFLLELEMSRLSHLEWYVQAGAAAPRRFRVGAHDPGPHPYRFPSVGVSLAPGEAATIYCRIASDTAVWLPFVVGTKDALWRRRFERDAMDQLYFGVGLALAGMSLGLALIYRRKLFVYTALLPLAYLGYYGLFFGYHHHWAQDWPVWVDREGVIVTNAAMVACFLLFIRQFLCGQEKTRVSWWLLGTGLALPGLMLVFALEAPYKIAIHFSHGAIAAAYLLGTAVVLVGAVQRRRFEDFLLAATCLLVLAGVVWLILQWMLVVPMVIQPMTALRVVSVVFLIFPLLACIYAQRSELLLEVRLALAERATMEAERSTLRAQLNPHFLLNTLNSIDALSHDDPSKIPDLVRRLGTFLRRCLVPTGERGPTLGDEMTAIRNYLEIEQVRYGDRLQVDYDIAAAAAAARIPEFLLQPLVENALKFGFKEQTTLQVRLGADVVAKTLRIWVENQGRLAPAELVRRYPGLGVDNVRLRLNLIYGERATFDLREVDGWVRAEIQLPLA